MWRLLAPVTVTGAAHLAQRDRVALLCVDEAGEQQRLSDEEDGRVVADQVPEAVGRVVAHHEAVHLSDRVRQPGVAAGGGHPAEHRRPAAHLGEDGRPAPPVQLLRHFKVAQRRWQRHQATHTVNQHVSE